jgi:hypothetical protein
VWVCFIGCLHPDIYRVNHHGRGRLKVIEGKANTAEQKYKFRGFINPDNYYIAGDITTMGATGHEETRKTNHRR